MTFCAQRSASTTATCFWRTSWVWGSTPVTLAVNSGMVSGDICLYHWIVDITLFSLYLVRFMISLSFFFVKCTARLHLNTILLCNFLYERSAWINSENSCLYYKYIKTWPSPVIPRLNIYDISIGKKCIANSLLNYLAKFSWFFFFFSFCSELLAVFCQTIHQSDTHIHRGLLAQIIHVLIEGSTRQCDVRPKKLLLFFSQFFQNVRWV